jgi:chromate transporter
MLEVFLVFLKLGLTSFGGPVAHLGFFHNEFVLRRKWLEEKAYADLVALCQFLPGPASSQVGMALGLSRAGYLGAFAAWLGFTLPSAIILVLFAFGINHWGMALQSSWLHGLKIAAVAVVAQAVWSMGKKLCPDIPRAMIALAAASVAFLLPFALTQIFIILGGGIIGYFFLRNLEILPLTPFSSKVSRKVGSALLLLFFVILLGAPLLSTFGTEWKVIDSFYRAGALVFGGGHVVLPLLKSAVVDTGWVSNDAFMAGYGAAQAIPGPLFTFTAYLGAMMNIEPSGILGAIICLLAAFLPSFLVIIGIMPFWDQLRKINGTQFALHGINAAVVGILLTAFYNPVWTSAIFKVQDFALVLGAFLLLLKKVPSWLVVILCSAIAALLLP